MHHKKGGRSNVKNQRSIRTRKAKAIPDRSSRKQDKPETKTITITVRDDKMILCCDRCFEVQPVDPIIKAWLGSERTGQFEAVVTPNSVDIRRKLATT